MKWIRYRIRTVPAAEDLIVSEMAQIGLTGAEIEDHVPLTAAEKEQIFTYDAEDPVNDGVAFVSFYAEEDDRKDDIAAVLQELRQMIDIGDGTIDVSVTDDSEWKDKWKQYFHSFLIDDLLVTPSWEKDTDRAKDARYVLQIDPGCAFGTGAHETTQLAVRALRKEIEARLKNGNAPCLLDIGTGSGVLSLTSLMFGASFAVATDLDPFVKEAAEENLAVNGLDKSQFDLFFGNLIDDAAMRGQVLQTAADKGKKEGFDIVVANILPVVLEPLTPVIPSLLHKQGVYITSGILREKEEMMRACLTRAGFHVREVTYQGEWCCLISEGGK